MSPVASEQVLIRVEQMGDRGLWFVVAYDADTGRPEGYFEPGYRSEEEAELRAQQFAGYADSTVE
jgi:hypothetical protein